MLGLIYSVLAVTGKLLYDGNRLHSVQQNVAVSERLRQEREFQVRREREEALRRELDEQSAIREIIRKEIDSITARCQEVLSDSCRILSDSEQKELEEMTVRKDELWRQYDISLRTSYRRV